MSRARDLANSTTALNVDGTIKLDGNYPVGSRNVALGDIALDDATMTGGFNTAIGNGSMSNNTTGVSNSALGDYSLVTNTTGSYNVALGASALLSNTTAGYNTAVGYQAGFSNTTSQLNTFLGYQAGYSNTSGTGYNTFVGQGSGDAVTTGSKNVILGSYSGNEGGLDIRTSSNYVVLADGDGNPRLYFNGQSLYSIGVYNVTGGAAANVYVDGAGNIYRSTSSLKYKTDVQDADHGLSDLMNLRSVTYRSKKESESGLVFGGLVAEEVHDAGLTEFVQYAEDGSPDALAYGNMVSLCIKAIQQQQAIITALEARITALEAN